MNGPEWMTASFYRSRI